MRLVLSARSRSISELHELPAFIVNDGGIREALEKQREVDDAVVKLLSIGLPESFGF